MNWPPWAQTTLEQAIELNAICPYCGEIDWYGSHDHTAEIAADVGVTVHPHESYEATHDTPTPILG